MAIDIRKSISKLFDDYGHHIIYVRRDLRFTCECYIERSGEASASCTKCFGLGYAVKVEARRCRRTIGAIPESLVGMLRGSGVGSQSPSAYVYYMEWDAEPKTGDMIMEVEWDDPESENRRPVLIKQKHLISYSDPQLGSKGRVEFYNVYCKYEPKGAQDETALKQY